MALCVGFVALAVLRSLRDITNATDPNVLTSFEYDYMLKDHLGSVRKVLTEELKMDKYPVVSLEDSKLATEDDYYTIDNTKIELATNGIAGVYQ